MRVTDTLLCLLLLSVLSCGHPSRRRSAIGGTVEVVVAKMDLRSGKVVGEAVLDTRTIQRADLTEEMVLATEQPEVNGAMMLEDLKRGRILTWSVLTDDQARWRQSKSVPVQARAFVLPLPHQPGVTRRVQPADHVDVLAVLPDPITGAQNARTLLRDVIVLNTGGADWIPGTLIRTIDKPRDSVTLLVLPGEAQILALAQRVGRLSLALANPQAYPGEDKRYVPKPLTVQELLEGKRAKELFRQRRRSFQRVPIIRSPAVPPRGWRPSPTYP